MGGRAGWSRAGRIWTPPCCIAITHAVRKGTNTVEVVNSWGNRLVGDSRSEEAERKTWTFINQWT